VAVAGRHGIKDEGTGRPFKNREGKAQGKVKSDAYYEIREGLTFPQQHSHRGIFNGLPGDLSVAC
jgi:hypothetical protein